MIKNKYIESWLKNKIITEEQAKIMLTDLAEHNQEKTSNKLITIISSLGAFLVFIGAAYFIASKWQFIPNFIKLVMFVVSTFATCIIGYLFKYRLKNLPKVGEVLLFLGTLLFGATVFFMKVALYIDISDRTCILIWFLGVLPFVYTLVSAPLIHFSALLFFIYNSFYSIDTLSNLLVFVSSVLIFNYGSLHYFYSNFYLIGNIYRLWGMNAGMLSLLFLIFGNRGYTSYIDYLPSYYIYNSLNISFTTTLLIINSIISVILSLILLWKNPSKSNSRYIESFISISLIISAAICFFIVNVISLYVFMFNVIFVMLLMATMLIGFNDKNIKAINIVMIWASTFIIAHYFNFFWSEISHSLFLIAGGLILIIGGIVLEVKRRNLKILFSDNIKDKHDSSSYIKFLFLILAIFWLIISTIIIYKKFIFHSATEITLRATSERTNYMYYKYDISNLDLDLIEASKQGSFSQGKTVFVLLDNKHRNAQAIGIDTEPFKDKLYLKGRVDDIDRIKGKIFISYNIENSFVDNHKEKKSKLENCKDIEVKVVVLSSGKAIFKDFNFIC